MSTLHTVNKSPFLHHHLESCLRIAAPRSSILLFEDAIYAALPHTVFTPRMQLALTEHTIYVLEPDLVLRGFALDQIITGIQGVDYAGFVDLVTQHQPIQAWL